ncbi:peroxidase-related enzyme [Xanthomonas sp. AmX2]|uniref:peroxidase-related enzyme n=1 Tax=Xanthomonas sp. TaxID=29446 RepID=UPI00197E03E9|nr:peroxidase-related enzyme [Xanthomonas sp.]MBN6151866.1 peroxidase-related enzyme [Xanthomonas sp.]
MIEIHGFTDAPLAWSPWLETVDPQRASPAQLEVLDESGANARQSPYYLTLAHQPDVLRQRSRTYNAIMYAPGGLPRAERELAATAVSRVNGCVYCGSVHARRFEQLSRREDAIIQVFEDPHSAGTTPRERAIVHFAVELTLAPSAIGAEQLRPLREAGLDDLEILDLIHGIAIFAWANRLMLNLGEPVAAAG